jgi:uncharacterized protein YkwD
MNRTLQVLHHGKTSPKDGRSLMRAYAAAHFGECPVGWVGRKRQLLDVAGLLRFAVKPAAIWPQCLFIPFDVSELGLAEVGPPEVLASPRLCSATATVTVTVTVDPTTDSTVEHDETVALSLAASTCYSIGTSAAIIGTIANDDVASTASALPRPKVISAVDLDSTSSSPATQQAGNAFDNKTSTKYLNFGGINSGVSFTYSLPTLLSSFVITTANDLPARDPATYQLYGFQGGSWRLLTSGKLNLPSGRSKDSAPVSLPNLPSLTQYRLIFPTMKVSGNFMQIADLKLFGKQSSPLPRPTTISAVDLDSSSASLATHPVANAFDNKASSKYLNFGGVNSGINFTYSLPTRLSSFFVTTANDLPGRDPAAYQLYGFSQGSWKLLTSGSLQLPIARLTDSAPISLPNLPSLSQYRLTFPRLKANGNVMQIAELKLFGSQSSSAAPSPAPLPAIFLAVSPASVSEDGPANLIYTFSRTGATTNALTVNYTAGGTATLGSDYTGIPATPVTKTITFAAGSATATVTVDPTTDSSVEPDETVALTLAAGTGYTVGTTAAVIGTITNDDLFPPSPSSTSTIYSGSFATPNEVDSYSVNVAPGTIISASITTPSQQSLYPLINLFDASSSLLKGSLAYDRDFADLGMFDLITGNATLQVGTQTGFLGDYELKISFINREAVKNEVVSLTNAQRLQAGLNPLTRNQLLESAAQAHVADMDASNRYLAHTGSNGSDPVTRIAATGYKGGWVDLGNGQLRTISSENAAVGYMTPAEVVNAWMNSAGHRAAILDPYTKEIGIGFEFDNEVGDITDQSYKIGTTYWVQNFGYPWQTGMQVWF